MKTKIIYKFRVVEVKAYSKGYHRDESIKPEWVWVHTIDRDYSRDHYLLQQKRRFWFGYKTLKKIHSETEARDKMEKLKEIYGEYA